MSGDASAIEDLMLYMSCSRSRGSSISLYDFDGVLPFNTEYLGASTDAPRVAWYEPDQLTPPLVGAWDVGLLVRASDGGFHLERSRLAGGKVSRRLASTGAECFAQVYRGSLREDGAFSGESFYMGWSRGKWRPVRMSRQQTVMANPTWDEAIKLHQSVSLTMRDVWRAQLRLENGPSVHLLTDPTGVRELFRLRDVPPGKGRREALRHWVAEHWRKTRKDPDVEAEVRAHLRGATEFTWQGLYARIIPSQTDIERDQELRRAGPSRRRRQRQ